MLHRFRMKDDQALLHEAQDRLKWRVANAHRQSKEIEAHYRARLVRALEASGVGPIGVANSNDSVDLFIAGHAVELKVCRAREKDGRKPEIYQALLHDPGNRHNLNGDLVLVLCIDYDDRLWPYVIPRKRVGSRRTVEITSHPTRYRGQWRPYLGAFDFFS